MKRVLVPVDFSEQSINAFRFALDITRQSQGTLYLLHVISLPVLHDTALMPVGSIKQPLVAELKAVATKKFERLIQAFNSDKVPVQKLVVTGRIHSAILNGIKEHQINLLVMGTQGASGLREWAVGSNTEKLVRTAPVPVIAIKHYTPANTIRNIIFPNTLDTENQEDLIMKIKVLQNFFQAQLHIIWINTPALTRPEAEIRKQLQAFAKRFMIKDYTINIFNYSNEEAGILEFTNQTGGDLIALGTHGLTGLAHMLAGSVAEDVVNHVRYPVWTYSSKSAKAFFSTQNNP